MTLAKKGRLSLALVASALLATSCYAQVQPASPAGIPISYNLAKAGNVSVAVYDGKGVMVRELLRAYPQSAGKQTLRWDGLNQSGLPVAPGAYSWKLLQTQGLEAEYLMSLGTNVGINGWPGVHGGPSSVTVAGDTMYMAGAGSETAPGIAASSLDGKFKWSAESLNGWDAGSDVSLVNGKLWYQYSGDGSLRAADPATGEDLKKVLAHRVPVVALALTGDEVAAQKQKIPGFKAFPLLAYSKERGYGWADTAHVKAFTAESIWPLERQGHAVEIPKGTQGRFLIDVPKPLTYPGPKYTVRLYLGGGPVTPQDGETVHIRVGPNYAGSYSRSNPPAGGVMTFTAEVAGDQMEIVFYADSAKDISIAVRGIEVSTCADRMNARGDQMVVAASGTSQVLWVQPEKAPYPAYATVTMSEPQPNVAGLAGGGQPASYTPALLTSIPDSPDRVLTNLYKDGGQLDIDVNLQREQTRQVALYFVHTDAGVDQRKFRVQVMNPDGVEVLDTREVATFKDGKYLVWNLRGHHILRISSLALGGPMISGLFFDTPAKTPDAAPVSFVKTDETTQGNWKGVYGSDGFRIIGDASSVIDSATVPNVQDVALLADGSTLAISGNDLVTFSRTEKKPVVRVSGLTAPGHLAVDEKSGDILVAQLGSSNQIVRFNRNYQKTATYGRAGGRTEGLYKAQDFAGISNIASDHRGGFLVSEWLAAPRRIAHFDAKGQLLHEWYGGQMFYHSPGVDPKDPDRVWLNSQFGWVMEMQVDYDKREWKVVSTWKMDNQLDPVLFERNRGFWVWMHPFSIGEGKNRTRYISSELAPGLILKPDYQKNRLVVVAAAGAVQHADWAGDEHPWKIAAKRAAEKPGNPKELHNYYAFAYADANGDEQMQPEEFSFWPTGGQWGFGYQQEGYNTVLDAKLNAWRVGNDSNGPSWLRLAPVKTTAQGLPVWDMAKLQKAPVRKGNTTTFLEPASDGTLYSIEYSAGDDFSSWWRVTDWEGHGYGWPGTMLNQTALVHRDTEGNILWQSGPHHSGGPGARGRLDMPQRISGIVNDTIGVANQTRQPCEFWTTDGLYVGGLFDRRAADGLPDFVYSWWKSEKGDRALLNYDMGGSGTLAQRPNGDVLFYGAGWNNVPVYRVNGWNQFVRQSGTVNVVAALAGATATGTGLKAEYFGNPDLQGAPAATRTDADIWFGYADKAADKRIAWPENTPTQAPFSVRWTGQIEAKFSERYTFAFYARNSGVRVWVGDEQVIDNWDAEKKNFGKPISLQAGRKYPLRIEWRQLKPNPEAHLNWESLSQPIEHVPAAYLYPSK